MSATSVLQNTRSRLRDLLIYFPVFLRNPIVSIKRVPEWDISNAVLLLVLVTIPSGILSGVISRNIMTMLWGIFLLPIITVLITSTAAVGFYYIFLVLFRRQVDPVKLYVLVVLSSIPFLALRILVPIAPPLSILAVLAAGALFTVGAVENFQLPRPKVYKLMGSLFVVFFVFWIYQTIQSSRRKADYSKEISPETLQQLKEEMEREVD
jgi:hypothetical protein